jgi:hypothetical protein
MSILSKFIALFTGSGKADSDALWIAVKCKRCGELTRARIDLRNDLSIEYAEAGSLPTYFCRKVLIGEGGHCFQRMEVELTFDANRKLVSRQVSGGQFVES